MSVLKGKLVSSRTYDSSEPLRVRFELTNTGPEDLYVLKWFTPLEGVNSDCLNVVRDGKRKVAYDGPMIKRGNPRPADYVLVPAGQTVTAEVDVGESYRVSVPADYQVELNIPAIEAIPSPPGGAPAVATTVGAAATAAALAKAAPRHLPLSGGKASFKVKKGVRRKETRGGLARKAARALAKAVDDSSAAGAAAAASPLPPKFVGGTTARKNQSRQAHNDGFALCETAIARLANDARYREWFGSHTASRLNKVKTVYTTIRDRMKSVAFTYNLTSEGCQSGWFAYTFKGDTTIWLCDGFWSARPSGTDSKAGTIVHEHSHSNANTDDLAYGKSAARALAAATPAKAVRNADNYEYFAES